MEEKMKPLLTAEGRELRDLLDHHVRSRKAEGIVDTFEVVFKELQALREQIRELQGK